MEVSACVRTEDGFKPDFVLLEDFVLFFWGYFFSSSTMMALLRGRFTNLAF